VQPVEGSLLGAAAPTSGEPLAVSADRARGGARQRAFPEVFGREKRREPAAQSPEPSGVSPVVDPPRQPSLPSPVRAAASGSARIVRGGVIERVMVGGTPEKPEARIRIGAGALAGSEFRVSAAAGQVTVEVRRLTATGASRETLTMAVDAIARRMRGWRRHR
jgi:hypothetical protein